ncbi:MAG: GAF domain-containing protein [Candidatus Kapaibacterium sp.]
MWQKLTGDLDALLDSTDHPITTLANAAALLFQSIERINWLGFYLFDGSKLYLGPFAGKPACTTIEIGKGVCGTAALNREVIVVDDVDKFPGHITCDADSRSEIVLPIVLPDGRLFGVLDVDSAELSRFGSDEKSGLQSINEIITKKLAQRALTRL